MSKLLSLSEAAKRMNLSTSTLRHQIRNGRFNAFKIGRDWVVEEKEVVRYEKYHKMPDAEAEKYRHRSRSDGTSPDEAEEREPARRRAV